MGLVATLVVLAVVVWAIPADGAWQDALVFVMALAVVGATASEYAQRRRRD